MQNNDSITSIYIHIPFCKKICSYCDFCKNFYKEDLCSKYLDSLKKEIKYKNINNKMHTIYIGGGTPSSLSFNNLNKLFDILKNIKLEDTYEFTFECNYEDIDENLLILLKNNRVNRLSIGLQTFNNKYSKFLNRNINKKEMIQKVMLSKKYFNNINLDLMYGFYNQTLEELKEDINEFIKLEVNHISTYCLIKEKHTMLDILNTPELDGDIQSQMYYLICNTLKDNGYIHYEISNFSKSNYESKHNLVYWNNEKYYGFGLGASGFINNLRYTNTKNIINYNKGNYIYEKDIIDKNQMILDEVMLNLRKKEGINLSSFKNKYNYSFSKLFKIDELLIDNLLIKTKTNIFIPEDKMFVSNEIIIRLFDNYLGIC